MTPRPAAATPPTAARSKRLEQVKHRNIVRDSEGYELAPAGVVSAALAGVMNGRTEARRLTFSDSPALQARYGPVPTLYGWLFCDDGREDGGFLVNLAATSRTVQLDALPGAWRAIAMTSEPGAYVIEDAPRVTTSSLENGVVELPPYSLVTFSKVE